MNDDNEHNDKDIARLLEAAGPREAMPDELRERWEAHFRSELAEARPASRRRFALPLAALAASVLVLMLVLDHFAAAPAGALPVQVVAVVGSADIQLGENRRLSAVPGQNLSAGATLETGDDSRLALNWAGFDVRLNAGTRLKLESDRLSLERGEVYVSDVGRRTQLRSATVQTPIATVRDIGTQFKVRFDRQTLTTSVREGSVIVATANAEHRADAAAGAGRTFVVNADESFQVLADSSDWSWIYPVSRRFELEGRTVLDFLRWSTSESGRELRFTAEAVSLAARNTRFSGAVDISGMDPEEAVGIVLSTTRFDARREPGVLLVSRRLE